MSKVLVADDSSFMRMRNVAVVKELGYGVIEAADGLEAVQLYKQEAPAAVLLDITMPNMDGLSALKEILAFDANARIAMVTAMGQQSIVLEAIKAGAKDFIVKPFDTDRVKSALRKLVA